MAAPKRKQHDASGSKFSKKKPKLTVEPPTKLALKQDRQSKRKHADVVVEAKALWNELRSKTISKERRTELMDQMMPLIKGKAHEIALQHDASRVVQAALQFGTNEQRSVILQELTADRSTIPELCKTQYAHFCVLKAIKYCHSEPDMVLLLTKAFKGHVAKLAVHAVGARCIEALFTALAPKQTASLKQELYGPHFALFANSTEGGSSLTTNLERLPDKKPQTLEFVKNLLQKGMDKSLYGYVFFQELLAEYTHHASPLELRALASSASDHILHLLSSRAGTKAAAALIAYGTPKDRKRMVKCLKGFTKSGLLHADAYLALIRLVLLLDDTVAVQKNLLNELVTAEDALLEVCVSDTGSKLLLMILVQDDERRNKYLDPYERSLLLGVPTIPEDGKDVPTSKKDPAQRRHELLATLKDPLLAVCTAHAGTLIRSIPGAHVLKEVLLETQSSELVQALVSYCHESLDVAENDDESTRLFDDRNGHLGVKNLILADESFAQAFVDRLGDRLLDVAQSNRGAFVVAALYQVPSIRLKLDVKRVQKLAKGDGPSAGYEALLKEMKKQK